jgi:hypothetical protein
MFIESNYESHEVRSSGARCFRQWYGRSYVSLLWSEEVSLEAASSINITSLRDEGSWLESLAKKKETFVLQVGDQIN